MNKIEATMQRFPGNAYDQDSTTSRLYKVIASILYEVMVSMDNIDRIHNSLSIDTISSDDIYKRFGALLNIERNQSETDEQYRNRLKTSITSLSGGTADAIRYAILCGLGSNSDMADKIQIYDAWKYDGDAQVYDDYGYVVCVIDLDNGKYSHDIEQTITKCVDGVKASGVIVQYVYYNFRIKTYDELDDITYASLSTLNYDRVGE